MINVFVQLVILQQVLEIVSRDQRCSVVCVTYIKYWLSLAINIILVPWSEVLTGNQEANGKPQIIGQYPWGSVTPYLVSLATSIAGECWR